MFHGVMCAATLVAALIRRERFHRASIVAAGAGISAYVVFLFVRMQ